MSPSKLPTTSKTVPRVKVLCQSLGYEKRSILSDSTQKYRCEYKSSSPADKASLRNWTSSGTQKYFLVMAQNFCDDGYGDMLWPEKGHQSPSGVPVWPKDDERITTALQQLFWRQNFHKLNNEFRDRRRQSDVSDTTEDEAPSSSFTSSSRTQEESHAAAEPARPRAALHPTYIPSGDYSMTAFSATGPPQGNHGLPRSRVDSQGLGPLDAPDLQEPAVNQLRIHRQSLTPEDRGVWNFDGSDNDVQGQHGRGNKNIVLKYNALKYKQSANSYGPRAPVANMIHCNTISAGTQPAGPLSLENSKVNAKSTRRSRPSEDEDETYTPTRQSKRKKFPSNRLSGSTTDSHSTRNQALDPNQVTQDPHFPSQQATQRHRRSKSTDTSPSTSVPTRQRATSRREPSDKASKQPEESPKTGDNNTSDPQWVTSSNPDGGSSAAENILPSSTQALPEQDKDRDGPLDSDNIALDPAEDHQVTLSNNLSSHTMQADSQEQSPSLPELAKAEFARARPAGKPAVQVVYTVIISRVPRIQEVQWVKGSLVGLSLDALFDKITILTGRTNIQRISFLLKTSRKDLILFASRDDPQTFDNVRNRLTSEIKSDVKENFNTEFEINLEPDPAAAFPRTEPDVDGDEFDVNL